MKTDAVERDSALRHLERVLASTPFRQAERSAGMLRYLVRRSLDGGGDRLKEYTVGVEALGRGTEFDPRTDPIVRAEASRLRARLERYYAGEGQSDSVVIELPKGTYNPRFHERPTPALAVSEPVATPRRRPAVWAALSALGIVVAFGAGVFIARSTSIASEPITRLDVELQSDELIGSDVGTDVAVAPDGSRAVFVSLDSLGVTHLRVRRFDGSPPVDLPGTNGGRGPFWSPDSRWIGFWAAGQLRKLAVDGGSPMVLCNANDLLGASWSENGTIVAALDVTDRLFRVDACAGGAPVAFLDLTSENAAPRWPQVLPDGKHVLYTAYTSVGVDQARIEVASIEDGTHHVVLQGGTFARFVRPNYLTFVNQGTLYAVRFDLSSLTTLGAKVPIIDDVAYSATFGFAQVSFADNGVAVYRRAIPNGPLVVSMIDSTGRGIPLLESPGRYGWPALSPDRTRLALSVVESGVPVLSVFTDLGERARKLWSVPGYDAPVWTHDGKHLVARGARGIDYFSAATGDARTLIENHRISVPWTFSPDDSRLSFAVMDSATVFDLWLASVDTKGDALRAAPPSAFLRTNFFETYPAISPDGRWMAYASSESGTPNVFVRSLTDSGVKVSIAAGRVPRWSASGQRLFFSTADNRLMVVSYAVSGGRFVATAPRQWMPRRLADTDVLPGYDLSTDGKSVVALLPAPSPKTQATNHVTLIRGLSDELRRKAP